MLFPNPPVICVVLLCSLSSAQVNTGTIQGFVFDATGAVVPGAAVELRHSATGGVLRLAASTAGFYLASGLLPDDYEITVSSAGSTSATACAGISRCKWGRWPAASR